MNDRASHPFQNVELGVAIPMADAECTSKRRVFFAVVALCLLCTNAVGSPCEKWIEPAARAEGVPPSLLHAISLVESGTTRAGRRQPWPWVVNYGGDGYWFSTRGETEVFVRTLKDVGAISFDVGCFQVNHRWHRHRFQSLEQMVDPEVNARVAARFLRELYVELGAWNAAAKAYHSRTPQEAEAYFKKLAWSGDLAPSPAEVSPDKRDEPLPPPPLLALGKGPVVGTLGGRRALGSLVPLAVSDTDPARLRFVN